MGLGGSHCVDHASNVDIDCQVWLHLAQGRQDASQVHDVVDIVILNQLIVGVGFDDVKLMEVAWEVKLLVCCVARYDVFGPKLRTQRSNEGHSDLALAASEQNLAFFPGLARLRTRAEGSIACCGLLDEGGNWSLLDCRFEEGAEH